MRGSSKLLTRLSGAVVGAIMATSLAPLTASAMVGLPHIEAHGSIDEAYVVNIPPSDALVLRDGSDQVVGSGNADSLGSLIVRDLTPGSGFVFTDTTSGATSLPFSVLSTTDTPLPTLYNQKLKKGLNYVTMRDGVKLAMTVRLPPGKKMSDGPFPTVMEYSGYATAGPGSLIDVLIGGHPNELAPSSSTMVGALIAPMLGFATVSVQMRGSGCSGGAFDLFGYPSDYDGYDAIETVATQSWVARHKVAMVGISYSGISQFEVAGTQPPSLAGILPLSPTDDLFSTGYPGGIYNNGFAAGWIAERIHDAVATTGPGLGQGWVWPEIQAEGGPGTSTCSANQALHGQSESLSTLVGPGLVRDPHLFDRRSPVEWAKHITVPVFLVGALQDEQTGPQWPALITALADNPKTYATMINGGHIDSLGPATISRWLEFLDIYLKNEVPTASAMLPILAPLLEAQATEGAKVMPIPEIRFTNLPNVAAARAAFKAENPRVRVLFDNGGTDLGKGSLKPAYEAGFASWPPSGRVTTWNLAPGGLLTKGAADAGTDAFTPAPEDRPATSLPSGNPWAAEPAWNWTPVPVADGVAYDTPAFTKDTTIVGTGTLILSLKSTAGITDLQATVTEVNKKKTRESYVTSGFVSSSFRNLLPSSMPLWPSLDFTATGPDLASGEYSNVTIPIDPITHTFRAGTSLRIVISAPGGDRPSWTFASPSTGHSVTDTIRLGGDSTLTINRVSGVTATAQPACGADRGQPCRAYQGLTNQIK